MRSSNSALQLDAVIPNEVNHVESSYDLITPVSVGVLFLVGIVIGLQFDSLSSSLIIGGFLTAAYSLFKFMLSSEHGARLAAALVMPAFAFLFLFETDGAFAACFSFFVVIAVLMFCYDWRAIATGTIFVFMVFMLLVVFRNANLVQSIAIVQQPILGSLGILLLCLLIFGLLCSLVTRQQSIQRTKSHQAFLELKQQLGMVDVNIHFADHISQGKLNAAYEANTPDKLGQSLINMRESLLKSAEREEKEKFTNVGLTRIGEILRVHADKLESLCEMIVNELVKYMKANQGSVFVMDDNDGNPHLKLAATWAWDRKKFLTKAVGLGEGLIGQAAIERNTIYLTDVPKEYISITSGLGEANPRSILIVPLKSEEIVMGVIELASFKKFQDYEISFLEKVGESIAATIITTRNNQMNLELLEKSNLLTEQMRAQEEEMRQNLEEMQATQEEMGRKNKEIERLLHDADEKEAQLQARLKEIERMKIDNDLKNEEILKYTNNYRQTLLNILDQLPHKIFLKDNEGKMALVNTVVAKAHNMTIDELIGKSDFDFVDHDTAQQWRNQELEIIKKGSETYIFNESIGGKSTTLKSTKMAFFIPHLNQVGLLGIQTDVTELEQLRSRVDGVNPMA